MTEKQREKRKYWERQPETKIMNKKINVEKT
jgi:hypothetical protein